jgi:hypothetical protein
MTEHSYLGIYTSHSIVDQIEAEDHDYGLLSQLLAEVDVYVDVMEQENIQFLEERKDFDISAGDTYRFLRCHERIRNTKWILQYLSAFMSNLPMELDLEDNLVNPFEQLKTFTLYNIGLLKEKDVEAAILKEHERLKLLNDTNSWYYRGQLDRSQKSLFDAIRKAHTLSIEGYIFLFQGIQQLCTFWFSVRNQEMHRVRKSDILMYKLTRYLLHKYKPNEEVRSEK